MQSEKILLWDLLFTPVKQAKIKKMKLQIGKIQQVRSTELCWFRTFESVMTMPCLLRLAAGQGHPTTVLFGNQHAASGVSLAP